MNDPTRNEMLTFLAGFVGSDQIDREEAIYWFANDYHSGQWSNLYSALSISPFRPSPLAYGPEDGTLYEELEAEFEKPVKVFDCD